VILMESHTKNRKVPLITSFWGFPWLLFYFPSKLISQGSLPLRNVRPFIMDWMLCSHPNSPQMGSHLSGTKCVFVFPLLFPWITDMICQKQPLRRNLELGVVACIYNPSTQR
jgi:hypothetical protein